MGQSEVIEAMKEGVIYSAKDIHDRIAYGSLKSVQMTLKKLVDWGEVECVKLEGRGRPHNYKLTGVNYE